MDCLLPPKTAQKQTVDVVAMRRRSQAIEARDLLEDNNIPYWCSVGIWLYRDSVDRLNQDLSDLIQRIPTAAKTVEAEADRAQSSKASQDVLKAIAAQNAALSQIGAGNSAQLAQLGKAASSQSAQLSAANT